jgi:hypothetical protein
VKTTTTSAEVRIGAARWQIQSSCGKVNRVKDTGLQWAVIGRSGRTGFLDNTLIEYRFGDAGMNPDRPVHLFRHCVRPDQIAARDIPPFATLNQTDVADCHRLSSLTQSRKLREVCDGVGDWVADRS